MYLKKIIFLILTFLISYAVSTAQEMQEGFSYLEKGEVQKAEIFFSNILKEYPDNKTASICYGRAVGLNQKSEKALSIFNTLLEKHPNDLEILLNIAEAHMWNKSFSNAKEVYEKIIRQHPENFTAHLGIANAYSALLQNVEANIHIKKALSIDNNHESAKQSKKYILLALSDREKNAFRFNQAQLLLDSVLEIFPDDREVILNKAICYLWMNDPSKASKYYLKLMEDRIDVFNGTMGYSYCQTLLHKNKKALSIIQEYLNSEDYDQLNSENKLKVLVSEINALGILKRYKKMKANIDLHKETYGDHVELLMAEARVLTWTASHKESFEVYQKLSNENPNNPNLYVGMAESLSGLHKNKSAIEMLGKALELNPNLIDAQRLKHKIANKFDPKLILDIHKSEDIEKNKNSGFRTQFSFGNIDKLRSFVDFQTINLKQDELDESANQYLLSYGLQYRLNSKTLLKAQVKPSLATDNALFNKGQLFVSAGVSYDLYKNQNIEYQFSQELHNFNVRLLKQSILQNHHKLKYSFTSVQGFGVYSEYLLTNQSDQNNKNQLYLALYHSFNTSPFIQTGVSYTYFTFSDQRPESYFSPANYTNYEGFIKVNNIGREQARFLFDTMLAYGIQTIDKGDPKHTLRLNLQSGLRFKNSIDILAYYRYSNSAISTTLGFKWSAIGLKTYIAF